MDQATSKGSSEMLYHVDKGVCENLSDLVLEGVATDRLGDRVILCGPSEENCSDLRLNKKLKEGPQEVKGDEDIGDPPKINDTLREVDQGTSYNSSNSVDGEVLETCVVIDSSAQIEHVNGDNKTLETKANESGLSKLSIKAPKGVSEMDKNSCVIDMNCGNYKGFSGNLESETICRICHLASGQQLEATAVGTQSSASDNTGLIMLGCACKDELGIAHSRCAEAWFKIKGNRLCEICGETAKNVPDVIGNGSMEDWSGSGFMDDNGRTLSRRTLPRGLVRCCSGQPFCNFLMACLVIAFILPWFFRVKI